MRDHRGERVDESFLKGRKETKRSRQAMGKREETKSKIERDTDRKGGYLLFSSRQGLIVALCASVKRSIDIAVYWMLGLCGPEDHCCYNVRRAV